MHYFLKGFGKRDRGRDRERGGGRGEGRAMGLHYAGLNYVGFCSCSLTNMAVPSVRDWPELPSVTYTGLARRIVQSEKAKLWSYPPSEC